MLGQLAAIARNTFLEAVRQPIYFLIVALCGVLQYLNTWGTGFALGLSSTAEVSGDNKLLLDVGLATVFVCGMLLAAFLATAVVSREIENKTVLTVVSKPIGRPHVVIGKFLGVAAAILIAVIAMLIFLLMAIRHGVLSTAADTMDGPVMTFLFLAIGISLVTGALANYLYGWPFSQTTMLLMTPLLVVAYLMVLLLGKKWEWQPITTNLRPQVLMTCWGLALAILVLTAVATAVSTRLGQVMTIVVCSGVFLFGLLSNHFLGRHAFKNQYVGVVHAATPNHELETSLRKKGDAYDIELEAAPVASLKPGMPLYWGANPNGFALATPAFVPFAGDPNSEQDTMGEKYPAAIAITSADGARLRIRNVGAEPVPVRRPPAPGDYVFIQPTQVRLIPATLWAVIPNMHYFWLLDAVTQNQEIPVSHMARLSGYAGSQIVAFLALGVILFQRRDVG